MGPHHGRDVLAQQHGVAVERAVSPQLVDFLGREEACRSQAEESSRQEKVVRVPFWKLGHMT
jgi:hypothetical protein